jgi:hypothetical protein
MSDAAGNVPFRRFNVTRIGAVGQKLRDAMAQDAAARTLREQRILSEKAHNVRLGLKSAIGKSFERFLHDRRNRLDALEHLTASRHAFVLVSDRRLKHGIAVRHARTHTIYGLLAILLTRVLRNTGQKILNQFGIGILAKLNRRRFQDAARAGDRAAQFKMGFKPARQTGHVVNDDDDALRLALAQIGEHRAHTGPVDTTTRHVVAENLDNVIALHAREFAAPCLLAFQAVAYGALFDARYAAINYR